jgi:hypothetical protein
MSFLVSQPGILRQFLAPVQGPLTWARNAWGMTLTTLITVNAVLGSALAYGLHQLLAHGIRSDRINHHLDRQEAGELSSQDSERIAA